jgi:hypothetical protein
MPSTIPKLASLPRDVAHSPSPWGEMPQTYFFKFLIWITLLVLKHWLYLNAVPLLTYLLTVTALRNVTYTVVTYIREAAFVMKTCYGQIVI